MKIRNSVIVLLCICSAALGGDTIAFNKNRPLCALAVQLAEQQYGYLVSYEEAPYDVDALLNEKSNGRPFSSPRFVPITFQLPNVTLGGAVPGAPGRVPAGLPDIVMPLIEQHHASGNPGTFSALFEGGYAHIVPAARIVNGQPVPFQPILGTPVVLSSQAQSCYAALNCTH